MHRLIGPGGVSVIGFHVEPAVQAHFLAQIAPVEPVPGADVGKRLGDAGRDLTDLSDEQAEPPGRRFLQPR